jgi:hypothetical protein
MIENIEIHALFTNPEDSYVIHFAYLETENIASSQKKIISIHAKNINSTDSREFSIDNFAAKNDIPLEDLEDWFDDIELSILDEFNSFLKEKSICNFIYYGSDDGQGLILDELKRIFEARNRADANKVFKEIPSSKRKNIPFLFQLDEQDKSIKSFIKQYNNNKLPTAFLSNGEEGVNFERKHFNKVRESVLCKIDFIIRILNVSKNKLKPVTQKSKITSVDLESLKPSEIFKHMNTKSWSFFIGAVIALFSLGMWVNNLINTNENNKLKDSNEKLIEKLQLNKTNYKERESLIIDSLNLRLKNVKERYEIKIDSLNKIKLKDSESLIKKIE